MVYEVAVDLDFLQFSDRKSHFEDLLRQHNIELSTRPASDKNHKDLERKRV